MEYINIVLLALMVFSALMFFYRYYSLMKYSRDINVQISFITSIGIFKMFQKELFTSDGQYIRSSAIFWFVCCNSSIISLILLNIF